MALSTVLVADTCPAVRARVVPSSPATRAAQYSRSVAKRSEARYRLSMSYNCRRLTARFGSGSRPAIFAE
nr:hypothetical protein GCM10017611_51110 [Rhodococcus wratislaviensis]